MTKNTEESGQEVENQESPAPTFSSPSADSQKNSQPVDASALAKEVAAILKPTIDRQVQSVKDKRFSQLEKQQAPVGGNSTLEQLERLGVDIPADVRDQLTLENRLAALERGSSVQTSVAPVAEQTVDWSKVIDDVGLDDRIPEVAELIKGTYENLDKFKLAAYELNAKLSNAKPLPPEQQAILNSGKPATATAYTDDEVREKEAELGELYKNPTKYAKRIANLEEDLEPYWTEPK